MDLTDSAGNVPGVVSRFDNVPVRTEADAFQL